MWRYVFLLFVISLHLSGCSTKDDSPQIVCQNTPEVFVLEQNSDSASVKIVLETDAGTWSIGPSYAVWVEYTDHSHESIYITCKAAKDYWHGDGDQSEGLPVWYGIRAEEGYTQGDSRLDAITSATPTKPVFEINWEPQGSLARDTIDLFVEANVPYDYNDIYNVNLGNNGQPSVIWMTSFIIRDDQLEIIRSPRVIGHSHPRGENHEIFNDLVGISTAVRIFKDIQVSIIGD